MFGADAVPTGIKAKVWRTPALRSSDYVVLILDNVARTSEINAGISVPAGGLPTHDWLRGDGKIYATPCP
jgi:hypothetical protein